MSIDDRTSHLRILIACGAAIAIANISWWMQPEIIHEILVRFGVSESQAGLVASVEFAAMSTASIMLARFARNSSYVVLAVIGTLIALLGAIASVFATSFASLVVERALTGIGEGASLMVSSAAIAHLRDPDRAYGAVNIVNVLLGSAVTFLLPALGSHFAGSVAFPTLVIVLLILLPFLLAMPRALRTAPSGISQATGSRDGIGARILVLAGAVFIVAVASSALWSFYFVFGLKAGLTEDQITWTIGLAVLAALPGSILAKALGVRFGRVIPTTVGLLAAIVAIVFMSMSADPTVFRVCACVNLTTVYFQIPYWFGFAAAEDSSGRGAAVVGSAFLFTGAVGPYFGGLMIQHLGVHSIAWFVACTNISAGLMFCWIDRTRAAPVINAAPVSIL
jgi:predicted MFS family arabinose efflux permease